MVIDRDQSEKLDWRTASGKRESKRYRGGAVAPANSGARDKWLRRLKNIGAAEGYVHTSNGVRYVGPNASPRKR